MRAFFIVGSMVVAQEHMDPTKLSPGDAALHNNSLNPYFSQNVDLINVYRFEINKDPIGVYSYYYRISVDSFD